MQSVSSISSNLSDFRLLWPDVSTSGQNGDAQRGGAQRPEVAPSAGALAQRRKEARLGNKNAVFKGSARKRGRRKEEACETGTLVPEQPKVFASPEASCKSQSSYPQMGCVAL